MTKDEFVAALKQGKGRALLHVRENGDKGLQQEILHACLHNIAYDTQLDSDRSEWLFEMLQYTADKEWYYNKILEKFKTIQADAFDCYSDSFDVDAVQLYGLVLLLEESSYANAKELLDTIDSYIDAAQQKRKPALESKDKKKISFDKFIEKIDSHQSSYSFCASFTRGATPAELKKVFSRLTQETDSAKLLQLLSVFTMAQLPSIPQFIYDLAAAEESDLQFMAMQVLANHQNKSVREFGLKLLQANNLSAVRIFVENYQAGDFALIQQSMQYCRDEESIHRVGSDILDICEDNNCPEAAECLIWVYEQSPCSDCRAKAVKYLVEINSLPENIAQEYVFDVNSQDEDQ